MRFPQVCCSLSLCIVERWLRLAWSNNAEQHEPKETALDFSNHIEIVSRMDEPGGRKRRLREGDLGRPPSG
jgi:hypothetical protein